MSGFWNRRSVLSIAALAIVALIVVYLIYRLVSASGEPRPTLVFFRVETCEFCRAMAPIVDDIARQHRGELEVIVLDVNTAPGAEAAARHGVVGTPTVLLFDAEDTQVGKYQGVVPQTTLEQAVAQLLDR